MHAVGVMPISPERERERERAYIEHRVVVGTSHVERI